MTIRNFRWRPIASLVSVLALATGMALMAGSHNSRTSQVPIFAVDPAWPTIPNHWVLGDVSSVAVDSQNHVWVLHRPRTVRPAQKSFAAPPVLVFDASGKFIKGWGGPGEGYEWPVTEHGIYVDYKGNVWIGGNDKKDNQILKFTGDGKFLIQIGHSEQSKGNSDTQNLNRPADTFVYKKTNELFVGDGYGNSRVIVFDADTGAFKRMWGAFGKPPTDAAPNGSGSEKAVDPSEGPPRFNIVHAARVSNDGIVYVADRANKRIQLFTLQGKFLKQVAIGANCEAPQCGNGQTAASVAFSSDPQQRFLFVADRSEGRILVLNRKTLETLYSFGKLGYQPGEFNILHHMTSDSQGNLYTTEVNDNFAAGECCRRVQKFVYKGLAAPPAN